MDTEKIPSTGEWYIWFDHAEEQFPWRVSKGEQGHAFDFYVDTEDEAKAGARHLNALESDLAAAKLRADVAERFIAAYEKNEGFVHHSDCAKWEHPGTNWSLNENTPCNCYLREALAVEANA